MHRTDNAKFASGLIAVGIFAFALRVAAVLAIGSYRLERVTYEHGEIARNLIEGRGFTVRWLGAEGPTSQQAPVYPTLVAVFYWLFGIQTPIALLSLQIFQALLGGLLSMGVVLVARELLPPRCWAIWLAGLGVAIYPTLIYAATQVQVATIVSLLTVLLLWTAARVARLGRVGDAVACGVIAGLLVLTDPIMILVVFVGAVMIALGLRPIDPLAAGVRQSSRSSLALACITLVVSAVVVAPWIVRNYRVHGELVFVKSTFGYAFWQGNHPKSFGTDKIPLRGSSPDSEPQGGGLRALERSLWRDRLVDTLYIDDAVLANERIQELAQLSEPARSRLLFSEAAGYIAQHPAHYARLCLQRLRYFLLFDETNPKSRVGLYRASHIVLQILAIFGLWLSRRQWRRLWPTYVVFLLVTVFHSMTIASARFHIPLEPIEWLWASFTCATAAQFIVGWCRVFATHQDCLSMTPGHFGKLTHYPKATPDPFLSGLSHGGRIQRWHETDYRHHSAE